MSDEAHKLLARMHSLLRDARYAWNVHPIVNEALNASWEESRIRALDDYARIQRLEPQPDVKRADVARVLREAYQKFPLEEQPLPVVSWIAEQLEVEL